MEDSPIVTVQEGKLRGRIATDYRGGKYFSFQGIPYAKPPVGELRFKAPQPPEPWSGIRDATHEGNPCCQRALSQQCVGTEDCLFLNVYTPQLPSKPPLRKPVMVWIHGGAFITGSGNANIFGPDFLITESVIIVTINYRLGLLGFLSLEDPSLGVPGNSGLKDQILALKWVQKNIDNFFGNPNNVTVFGEGAGASSIHHLMMSPMAKGLFSRAIIQNGTVLNSWTRGQRSAPLIAKILKHETVDEKAILGILKNMPMAEILELQEKILSQCDQYNSNPLGPVIENKFSKSPFLIENPIDLINSGRFNKLPLMMGYNSKEGMYSESPTKSRFEKMKTNCDFENLVPWVLGFQKGSNKSKEIAQKIKEFYYEENGQEQYMNKYYKLEIDSMLLCNLQYILNRQMRMSPSPIYLYRIGNISDPGVGYADELGYLFKNSITPPIRLGSTQDENIKKFVKLWTTFAKNGDPNSTQKDSVINVTWKPVKKGEFHFLNIGENLTVGINPDARRMAFWAEIFDLSLGISKL